MATIDEIEKSLGVPYALNNQHQQKGIVAFSDNPYSAFDKEMKTYVTQSQKVLSEIIIERDNVLTEIQKTSIRDPFKYNGRQVFRYVESSFNKDSQISVESLSKMTKQGETASVSTSSFGDPTDDKGNVFEMKIEKEDANGNKTGLIYSKPVRPNDDTLKKIGALVAQMEEDPRKFQQLNSTEKDMLLSLLRFSKYDDGQGAAFHMDKDMGSLANTIEKEFRNNPSTISKNYNRFVEHLKSGLRTISDKRITSVEKAQETFDKKANTINKTLTKPTTHVSFDIETMGDTEGKDFSVTEIAMNEYDTNTGKFVKNGYTKLLRPSDDTLTHLNGLLETLRKDPATLNRMSDTDKRSIVDTMRYSLLGDEAFTESAADGAKHNSIVENELTFNEKINYNRFFDDPGKYISHMESGIQNLWSNKRATQEEGARQVAEYITKQNKKGKIFESFNGQQFDTPTLERFMENNNVASVRPDNKFDLLSAIKTVYQDPKDAMAALISQARGIEKEDAMKLPEVKQTTSFQLQKFGEAVKESMQALYGDQNFAHNASADTNLTAYVASLFRKDMQTEIEKAHRTVKQLRKTTNMPDDEGVLRINQEGVHVGDRVMVQQAYRSWRDGDKSFKAIYDEETGEWAPHEYGNNKLVTEGNGKEYIFQGMFEQEVDGEKHLLMHLYQPDTKDHSFIVRNNEKGQAFDELTDVFHQHFVGYSDYSEKVAATRKAADNDNARRAYDRMFTSNKAGYLSKSEGIQYARQMYSAARTYQNYRDDRTTFRLKRAQELVDNGEAESLEKAYQMIPRKQDGKDDMLDKVREIFTNDEGVHNKKAEQRFWRMSGRLSDEVDLYEDFFTRVDEHYEAAVEQAMIENDEDKIRQINRQKEIALVDFHQRIENQQTDEITNKVYVDNKTSRPMKYITVIDRRFDKERSLNVSSVEQAQKAIQAFMNDGVSKNSEHRQQVRKERLIDFSNNLLEQNIIGAHEHKKYVDIITSMDSPYNATHSIAKDLVGGGKARYELRLNQEASDIQHNYVVRAIKDGNIDFDAANEIDSSIDRAESSEIKYSYSKALKESTVELPKNIREALTKIETNIKSEFDTGNEAAIKNVIEGFKSSNPMKSIAIQMNGVAENGHMADPSIDFYVYDNDKGGHVQDALLKGEKPSNVLHVNMPLISELGTIRQGNVISNADRTATYNKDKNSVELKTTVEQVSDDIRGQIKKALKIERESGTISASKRLKNAVRDSLEHQSGINRNTASYQLNDTAYYKGNTDDYIKQNRIRIETAMIQDVMANGFKTGTGKLTINPESDLMSSAYYIDNNGTKKVKHNLTFEDINPSKVVDLKMEHLNWARERIDPNLHINSVKSSHAGEMVSTIDMRDNVPLGNMYEHKRDNLIQFQNLHNLSKEARGILHNTPNVSNSLSYMAPGQLENLEGKGVVGGLIEGDFAIMTNEQIQRRINQMMKDSKHREVLLKEGILNKDGSVNALRMPTTYEQQGILSNDVMKNMNYEQSKTYNGRLQLAEGFEQGGIVKPGDVFAYETLDNGTVKKVRYESKFQGTIQSIDPEAGNIKIRWQENAFKFMMNGEKMTANGFSQNMIEALTGMKNIIGIYDSNVLKHGDIGQFAAGKISILANAVRNVENPEIKQKYIGMMENGGIGVEWDAENNTFIDKTNVKGFTHPGETYNGFLDNINTLQEQLKKEMLKDGEIDSSIDYRNLKWTSTLETPKQIQAQLEAELGPEEASRIMNREYFDFTQGDKQVSETKPLTNQVERYRMQFGMAGVADYSKAIDGTGQQVLRRIEPGTHEYDEHIFKTTGVDLKEQREVLKKQGIDIDRQLKPVNVYKQGREGVTVRHREMRIFTALGLESTHDYLQKLMLAQATDLDMYGQLQKMNDKQKTLMYSGLEEDLTQHMEFNPATFEQTYQNHMNSSARENNAVDAAQGQYKALQAITGEYQPEENEKIYRHDDFKELPITSNDESLYKGTFLDTAMVKKETGNRHGFFLEMPKVIDSLGNEMKVQVKTMDGKKEIDKVFMPFTTESKLNGNQFLDKIQQVNAKIMDAASKVDAASTTDGKQKEMAKLQDFVHEQTMLATESLTSSKGLVGESVLSAKVSDSASGLYKLVDEARAAEVRKQYGLEYDLDGQRVKEEFTAISEETAKKMGIHDSLKAGKEIYGGHVRFPSFHDGAVQFNRIIMDSNLRQNEFHTSDVSSMLKRADSDGDMGHMFVINDDRVQEEWKAYQAKHSQTFASQIEDFQKEFVDRAKQVQHLDGYRNQSLEEIVQEKARKMIKDNPDVNVSEATFKQLTSGNVEEVAAKIGKITIGQASNLNFFMQQVAEEQFAGSPKQIEAIKDLGAGLEQKIISSKHGGKPMGLDLVNAIKNNNWDRALAIDKEYFGSEFTDKHQMGEVAEFMPDAIDEYDEKLRSVGLRMGTSSGIGEMSAEEALSFIRGDESTYTQQTTKNEYGNLLRRVLEQPEMTKPINDMDLEEYRDRISPESIAENRKVKEPLYERARRTVTETGKSINEKIPSSLKDTFNNFAESGKMKKAGIIAGLVGGGMMVGGMLSHDDAPEMQPYVESKTYKADDGAETRGKRSEEAQGANIQVRGKSQSGMADGAPAAAQSGIADSNMDTKNINVNLTTTDNTEKLNRNWYRDKVQENY